MSSALADEQLAAAAADHSRQPSPAALDNFSRVFAIGPEDRVLLLLDRKVDPRIQQYFWEFARSRGAGVQCLTVESSGNPSGGNAASKDIPDEVKPLAEWATFVVSTWFSSVNHPFFTALRRDRGQRWVKITHFRNLDLLKTEAAAFPLDVISLLLKKTAAQFPREGDVQVRVTDPRGTDISASMSQDTVSKLLRQSRWRGEVTAEAPGCYIHYLPTHGPNFCSEELHADWTVAGTLIPEWSVGFAKRFDDRIAVEIKDNECVSVGGSSAQASILRDMLIGSHVAEFAGCGFNPKWPREQIYPAGPNSPGGLHFGLDLREESEYIRKMMPDWPEPPVHMDLVDLDATVTLNGRTVVDGGFLCALRDAEVRALAARYGDPVYLLERWP